MLIIFIVYLVINDMNDLRCSTIQLFITYTEHLLMNLLSLIMIEQHLAGLRKSALCSIRHENQRHTHP